jgi:signal recognition particle subunit SRP54
MMKGQFTWKTGSTRCARCARWARSRKFWKCCPASWARPPARWTRSDVEKNFKHIGSHHQLDDPRERRDPDILNASRRRRIAAGCGMEVQDVNRLIKQYREAQKLMKMMQKTGTKGMGRLFG